MLFMSLMSWGVLLLADCRSRIWTFLVWPESAPPDWESIIDEHHVEWGHSPLHDKDKNPYAAPSDPDARTEFYDSLISKFARSSSSVLRKILSKNLDADSVDIDKLLSKNIDQIIAITAPEFKKPHWHCIISFDGKKSYEQVEVICKEVCTGYPKPVDSATGLIRYFVHRDNPEKAQYSESDCKWFGGFDPDNAFLPCRQQKYRLINEMQEFCDYNSVYYFDDLFRYARKFRKDDWFPALCENCSFAMNSYVNALRFHRVDESRGLDSYA